MFDAVSNSIYTHTYINMYRTCSVSTHEVPFNSKMPRRQNINSEVTVYDMCLFKTLFMQYLHRGHVRGIGSMSLRDSCAEEIIVCNQTLLQCN